MLKTGKEAARAKARPKEAKSRSKARSGAKVKAAPELEEAQLDTRSQSRLEARIPTALYEVMERAATLRGLTMTAYVTATMGEHARRTIEESSIIHLSRNDQIAFANALINPPTPNAKLLAAKRRHAAMIKG